MSAADNEIKGRLVLITGASGGIGSACARLFAKYGCHLALTYSTNVQSAEELAAELRGSGDGDQKITLHKADMANADEVTSLCVQVQQEHGRAVDILVPNAGYGVRIREVDEIPLSEFEHTINVNLRAPFILVKGVVEGMKKQRWGRIIFMGSIAAYGGGINGCHYAASKGGMMGMMKNLSTTLAPYNISVNDVAPALIGGTGMMTAASGKIKSDLADSIPLKRMGETDEIARAVVMFATTGFATGQSLVIAGGLK